MTAVPDRWTFIDGRTASRLICGLWQVADMEKDGSIIAPEIGADALESYAKAGFDTFDMADHYGNAELIAGALLARSRGPGPRPLAFTKWCPEPGPMTAAIVRDSVLARLDNITVGGLGFNLPLGANPRVEVWIPDVTHLTFNASPYNAATNHQGIFLTYPNLDSLLNFTSLNFTKIIKALKTIADNLSQLSAFSFLDQKLPFVNISVNDMINYATKFADLIDAASGAGSQSTLQNTIKELEHQIELLFDLDPSILTVSLDDGGISGLSGRASGGVNGSSNASSSGDGGPTAIMSEFWNGDTVRR